MGTSDVAGVRGDVPSLPPRLIKTQNGFTVLYRNTYLYSKYRAQDAHERAVARLAVKPHTLVLCCAPVLGHGLCALLTRMPPSSFLLCLECDLQLMHLFMQHAPRQLITAQNVYVLYTTHITQVLHTVERLTRFPFKQILKIAGSGAYAQYRNFYDESEQNIRTLIDTFWINKITLIHSGRNYARNIFSNYITQLQNPSHIHHLVPQSIDKPLLIVGAGPALDACRSFCARMKDTIFLLAVDVACNALLPDIVPDAVVLLESQFWIEQAFIGTLPRTVALFADLSAFPRAVRAANVPTHFFFTPYTHAAFIKRAQNAGVVPLSIHPSGSVGLAALQLALRLRKKGVPIFHTGLNFSWNKGFTHARGSAPVQRLYHSTTRLHSLYPDCALFPEGIRSLKGKRYAVQSIPNLVHYAHAYRTLCAEHPHLYDLDQEGLALTTSHTVSHAQACEIITHCCTRRHRTHVPILHTQDAQISFAFSQKPAEDFCLRVKELLTTERAALLQLKHMLTTATPSNQDVIRALIRRSDYLYLHFPDGERAEYLEYNFLCRVRAELDFFLKLLSRIPSSLD
ncbi:6-hydroxymethylpterin diphosphokinase MptE-like protein [Treponema pallidum]|nr:6-hydroxymethylpterin diphosphokinase MptE-like protein [Treponema pallidum]AHN67571.1 hypothetical protein TPSea814_000930 [Treponema pallidum subsp. pallidum str. Sea 81-4]ANA42604.1 hypothetical protein A4W95_00793 [Treponema pallidum subsp. pallidum]QUJ38094.2 DUF115 domain-containing protein [Treponema pallidum]QUJ39059.2 DUF115 domain-containing protein [Treponema pallidum]QUJ40017.2 DUF115 domain-containing protein [Treponema pallidum]